MAGKYFFFMTHKNCVSYLFFFCYAINFSRTFVVLLFLFSSVQAEQGDVKNKTRSENIALIPLEKFRNAP
jgi:hypothetical protein